MASKINSVGDNGSDLGKGDSNMDPDCVVEKLSVSLQSCEPFCTPQVDSFQSLVVGPDTLRTDLITGALDDISIAESSGQKKDAIDTVCTLDDISIAESSGQKKDAIDTVGKHDVASDSKSKGPGIICSSLWTTNDVSIGSQLKTDAGRPFRKCKKLSNKKISPDIKFVELSRKRRSFSNKARISNWGSLESIGDVFNQTAATDADLDQNEHRKSRKAKGREGDVKRKINQSRTSLLRSKKKIHASTNRIRLKVTFGGSCPLDVTSGVVDDHKSSSSMQIKSTIYNEETERKLEQGIPSATDGHDGIAAQKEVGLFEEAVVSRCLDPGTSPDSEVINLIPENHTEEKVAEYVILNKQTCIAPEEVLSTSLPMKCSRKGKKKNKYCQDVNCNTNNKPPPDTIDHTGVTDQHRHFARSTNDVLLNEASRSTTARNISVKISSGGVLSLQPPLQSSVVTDCGGVSETFKAKDGAGGGSCSPTGFQHKTLEKSCPLPKLRDGANTISSRSPRSRLEISKAQSPDKNSCLKEGGQIELKPPKKSNCVQAVNKKENYLETGSHTLTDHGEPITGCSITPEVTYVNMNGVKDEHVTPRNAWVSCDNCYKWRRIPAVLADSIEDTKSRWICKDNVDKDFADCSIPQEKSNAEINAELDISDASCEEDAGAALHEPSKFEKKKSTDSKQSSWKLIKLNHFLHRTRKTQTIDEIMVCHCKAPSGGRMGCGNGCLNRMLNIECVKGTCPCGEHCSNNQFQKRKYAKLKCFRSGKKGCGLQLLEDIREGQFLIEYVGEVLDMNAYEDRQKEYALKGHKHFYFMTLNGSEVIDACAKGNLGRYINHSCEPNCRTEKWMVNGEVCVGLFAIRDIKKGEEVTFDYNYVRVFGAAAKKCVCGSSLCQGYIGGDPSSDAIIVQDDSDEEDPESVMVCEDSDDNLDSMVSASNSADVIDTCYAKKNVGNDERVIRNLEVTEEMHTSYGLPKQRNETNMFKSSGNEGYVQKTSIADHESQSTVNLDGNVSSSASMQPIDFMPPEDGKGKFIHVAPSESCSEEHLNKLSTTQSSEISAAKSDRSSMDNSDIRRKFKHDVRDGRNVLPASHHKTKVSYSVSSVKNGKPRKSDVLVKNPAEIGSRLHHLPFKSKRPVNCSPSDPFEAVQVKLNELLDAEGGISKKKDASRGYLKLLFLTAASENSANGEAIQSNRDLSMILDALLKTKSRTVLADVINKNGLQMLHNIMKRCRKEFHKIPILRKLLKVLEYLAVKEILTLEHITSGPRFAGVESFRESILSLTEHDDKQVHKIARTFRDKWIRRPTRNKNYTDIDTGKVDFHRGASNCNRSALQSPCDMGVGLPGSKEHIKKPVGINRVTCENLACCSVSCSSECVTNKTSVRKRKSRWDQSADSNFGIDASSHKKPRINSGSVQVSISSPHHGISGVLSNQAAIMYEENSTNRSINYFPHQINVKDEDDNGQKNIDEDIPPGFSAREGFFVSSSASSATVGFHQEKCSWPEHPCEVVRGHPQKMFISRLPVSFGIPLLVVEQFGRPLVETSENWVVAAGIPFHPYPPLPTYPHDRRGSMPASCSIVTKSAPVFGEDSRNCGPYQLDQSTCSTPYAAKTNLELDPAVNQHNSQRTNGASNCLERRYFRQQKWSNTKSGHPWVQGRAGRAVSWNSKRNGMNSIGIGTGPRDLKGPTSSERIHMEVGHCGNTFPQHLQQNN